MSSSVQRIVLALTVLATSACTTARYYDARYVPAPLDVEVSAQAIPGSQVRALASVLGIARQDEKAGRAEQVEVRMRLENLGTVAARVAPDGFSLLSADLVAFAPAVVPGGADLAVPAGETRTIDIAFASPGRELDWSGLNLRFALYFDDVRVTAAGTFARTVHVPIEPVRWRIGFGYSHGYCW